MCGIDPGELTPFQGGPFHWTFPGVETPGLSPAAPFAFGAKKKSQTLLILAPFGFNPGY